MTKNNIPTVAVTGATGFLGSELVKHFLDNNYKVIALVRKPHKSSNKNLSYIAYDIAGKIDDTTLKGVNLVVHTAYIKYDVKNPQAMQININGAIELLRVSRKNNVAKNIFISTMSAHDAAESVYGKQKMAIEALFSSKNDAVIRSGLIVGNGGIVREMAEFMLTKHAVPLIGGGKQPLQTIGVYDLARVVEAIYTKKQLGSFTIASPEVYTYKDFYRHLGKRLDAKFIFVPLPLQLLYIVVKTAARLGIPLSVSTDNVLGLKKLTAMETAEDLAKLGITIDDLPTALKKTKITIK